MSKQRGTVLYDAVYLAAHDMLAQESGRKAIILITDGEDEGSKLNIKDAIEAAQKADTIIYSILYVDRRFYGGFNIGYSGESALKQLSEETGGRVFTVGGKNTLPVVFDQIQQEMRTQYLIGYSPTTEKKDGTYRKIDLKTGEKRSEGPGTARDITRLWLISRAHCVYFEGRRMGPKSYQASYCYMIFE